MNAVIMPARTGSAVMRMSAVKIWEKVSRIIIAMLPGHQESYRFSKAMTNSCFIGIDDIKDIYLPMGFSNYKIEGRGLGSALILEFLLYYMTRSEYQLLVREAIYLDNMLDLF